MVLQIPVIGKVILMFSWVFSGFFFCLRERLGFEWGFLMIHKYPLRALFILHSYKMINCYLHITFNGNGVCT